MSFRNLFTEKYDLMVKTIKDIRTALVLAEAHEAALPRDRNRIMADTVRYIWEHIDSHDKAMTVIEDRYRIREEGRT